QVVLPAQQGWRSIAPRAAPEQRGSRLGRPRARKAAKNATKNMQDFTRSLAMTFIVEEPT
ncbi:MAG: hypothetical protein K8R69_10360, partial [Deltaproteobacteria bacterium]|nr:hypothetical protein [Deltaproteobacteria bacterium]